MGCTRGHSACAKVDIFAFGVILLELISAREDLDGNSFKECIKFLGEEKVVVLNN